MDAVPLPRPSALRLPGPTLAAPLLAVALGVLALVVLAGGRVRGTDLGVVLLGAALASPVAATVLLDRVPGHPLGLVLCLPGLVPVLGVLVPDAQSRPLPADALQLAAAPVAALAGVLLVAVPLLFPDGRPGRSSVLVPLTAAGAAVVGTATAASGAVATLPESAWTALLVVAAAVAHVVQAVRWRRATGIERARRGWYAVGSALVLPAAAALLVTSTSGGPPAVAYALAGLVALAPVGVVGLVLAPSPPPLDRVLVRVAAIVAGAAALVAVHAVSVAGLAATDLPDSASAALVLTAVAALAGLPLWLRGQAALETRLFGLGRQPALALGGLQERLASTPGAGAGAAATAWLAATVRSPTVRLVDGPPGADGPADAVVVPLALGGAAAHLVVAPRRSGERYGRRDRELLTRLAVPVALVLQAEAAARALADSERQVVAERDRERRRVLDELHDTLGPALAGIGLQLTAARARSGPTATTAASEAAGLLESALVATAQARRVLRRLVDDLDRTAPVAAVPLRRALEDLTTGWTTAAHDLGLHVTLVRCEVDEPLPAGVHATAVRVVGEALTNVVRHAGAESCTVQVESQRGPEGDALLIEVRDDGCGGAGSGPSGVGLQSLSRRAAALGGALTLSSPPGGGTVLTARLPVRAAP